MIVSAELLGRLLAAVIPIIHEAGRIIMRYRVSIPEATVKPDQSPVTLADLASDHYLRVVLPALSPSFPVVSEEGEALEGEAPEIFWLVDPLDGTREFISGSPDFGINIALVAAGVPVLGAVYAPARQTLYTATAYSEACTYLYDSVEADTLLEQHTLQVLAQPKCAEETIVTMSRHFYNRDVFPYIQEYTSCLALMGSALKICAVADATAHIYPRFGKTCCWDTAAGQVILERAGGVLVDFTGQALRYAPWIQSYNPEFCAAIDWTTAERLLAWVAKRRANA